MPEEIWAKVNGKRVRVERMSPDDIPFIANPRVQDTVAFMTGVGMGLYKGARNLAGYLPNTTGMKIKRAMPWGLGSVLTFFLAPACGKARNVVRAGGVLLAGKAVYEVVKSMPKPERIEQGTEV